MAREWKELLVLLHGISPDREERRHEQEEYGPLYRKILVSLKSYPHKPAFWSEPIMLEWGSQLSGSSGPDRFLTVAQDKVLTAAERVDQWPRFDPTLDPLSLLRLGRARLREWLILGVGDLIYYLSRDGEAALRHHIFSCLHQAVQNCLQAIAAETGAGAAETGVSLTIVGHSAGGIIMHDLLYQLFRAPTVHATKAPTSATPLAAIDELRALIHTPDRKDRRLRIRRFYTMGSPITPLMIRSDSLIEKLTKDEQLELEDLGLDPDPSLANPRWVNFVDKDDPAGYALEFFYHNPRDSAGGQTIEDRQVDVGDNPISAHGGYWSNRGVADVIAATF
jgi:hypothetical protein